MAKENATMPQPKEIKGGFLTHSIKIPERSGSKTNFILIQTLRSEGLTEVDPTKNAKLLCDYLLEAVEESQLLALRDELNARLPISQ